MDNENDKKKKGGKLLDKVLMGAIIGGAIGSVVGASIAPKKGKQTREEIAEKAKVAGEKSSKVFSMIKKWIFKKEDKKTELEQDSKKIPHEHV